MQTTNQSSYNPTEPLRFSGVVYFRHMLGCLIKLRGVIIRTLESVKCFGENLSDADFDGVQDRIDDIAFLLWHEEALLPIRTYMKENCFDEEVEKLDQLYKDVLSYFYDLISTTLEIKDESLACEFGKLVMKYRDRFVAYITEFLACNLDIYKARRSYPCFC